RLRERPVLWSMLLIIGANVAVFWSLANDAAGGSLNLGAAVMFAQSAVGTSMIAFGGLNWALDGASAPVAAVLRLEPAMGPAGALTESEPRNPDQDEQKSPGFRGESRQAPRAAGGMPAHDIRFRDVTFS